MTEANWLSLIAGLMVLVLLIGGLARSNRQNALRLFLLWAGIIALATIAVTYLKPWL